jgi:hypothetical protein
VLGKSPSLPPHPTWKNFTSRPCSSQLWPPPYPRAEAKFSEQNSVSKITSLCLQFAICPFKIACNWLIAMAVKQLQVQLASL